MLFDGDAGVGTFYYLYAGEGKEEGYLDVLHGEGVIAVLSLYLFADNVGDEFQLLCGASVPLLWEGEIDIHLQFTIYNLPLFAYKVIILIGE